MHPSKRLEAKVEGRSHSQELAEPSGSNISYWKMVEKISRDKTTLAVAREAKKTDRLP